MYAILTGQSRRTCEKRAGLPNLPDGAGDAFAELDPLK